MKFRRYRLFPELKQYVLISQEEAFVEVFSRSEQGFWILREYQGLDAEIDLDAIDVKLPLRTCTAPWISQPKHCSRYTFVMGSLPALARLTPEQYLDFERDAFERHEYVDGLIYAMSGGTPNHALIAANTITALNNNLGNSPCRSFGADLKIWIPKARSFLYPDVSVVCGAFRMKPGSTECVENPSVIFEVLSDSTERYDRTKKFRLYKSVPELKHYVLIQQNEPWVDVFTSDERGFWYQREYAGLDSAIELEALHLHLSLAEIYRKVDFATAEEAAPVTE